MRMGALLVVLVCICACCACTRTNAVTEAQTTRTAPDSRRQSTTEPINGSARVDFQTQIKPILEARCQPCHFSGGKVYQKMPFDRPETIKSLGTKLFTRIKDENERRLIGAFLTQ
jgi:hypothetical protein